MGEIEISHKELAEMVKLHYKVKLPLWVWGTMGIGKSSVVLQASKELAKEMDMEFTLNEDLTAQKFGFIDMRASQLEPSDVKGIPTITTDSMGNQVTKWILPNWLPKNKDSKGILFFDELNLANQSVQSAFYQLIQDRKLDDYTLPNGWIIISAGNTTNDKANVFDVGSPLLNRFTHSILKIPSKDEWIKWGLQNNIHNSILAFLEFKPSFLYKFDRQNKDKSFPTPRTWEFASKLLSQCSNNLDTQRLVISSAIGEGVATEFMAFVRLQNKINIDEIFKNPESVQNIKEIDLKYSLLGIVTEKYREDKKHLEKCIDICKYLEPEFAILQLRYLSQSKNSFKSDVIKLKGWLEIFSKYAKYLTDLKDE